MLKIKKLDFEADNMKIFLTGGRILHVPLKNFPEIKKLSDRQRSKYHIAGGISLDFDDSDEVFHLNELIGI